MRSAVVVTALLVFALPALVVAWDQQPDGYEIIDGPTSQQGFDTWRQEWEAWKKMELRANRYNGTGVCDVYNLPATQWTQNNFVQVLLMLNDRAIYDREKNEYTVDRYVDAMEARVGKLDSVLIWSSYPNIGIDNRNQWDLIRTLPGGIAGVRKLVNQFQKRGIRVIITYNPWDTATRDEDDLESTVRMYNADIVMLNQIITDIQADGFNGDTMYGVPKSFYNCSNPLVATPEGGVPTAFLSNNPISWGYFWGYSNFPPVSRAKFLEPRHMVQVCARWSQNKMVELQAALFNGIGYVLWENVWGIWNTMAEREDEAAKRIFTILRKFSFATTSATWRPYSHGSRDANIYVSEFPAVERGGWFYTVISASDRTTTFRLPLSASQSASGTRIYDVYHGKELKKRKDHQELSNTTSSDLSVQIELEPYEFGAIFVANNNVAIDDLDGFLRKMQLMTKTRLADFSMKRSLLKQEMIGSDESPTTQRDDHDDIEGHHDRYEMVFIRGATNWWFNVTGVQIEPVVTWTPNWPEFGAGVQFPWELRPWNNHSVRLTIQDFQIGKYPVTNLEYSLSTNRNLWSDS
uniref:Chromo domain-containing protein n=1 Tax=Globisporangium ultimum (strain ATCC 200006 / CBS 805.95 / DAOM BR144) TaxID=431595 RepID=K3XA54_GLOUD